MRQNNNVKGHGFKQKRLVGLNSPSLKGGGGSNAHGAGKLLYPNQARCWPGLGFCLTPRFLPWALGVFQPRLRSEPKQALFLGSSPSQRPLLVEVKWPLARQRCASVGYSRLTAAPKGSHLGGEALPVSCHSPGKSRTAPRVQAFLRQAEFPSPWVLHGSGSNIRVQ